MFLTQLDDGVGACVVYSSSERCHDCGMDCDSRMFAVMPSTGPPTTLSAARLRRRRRGFDPPRPGHGRRQRGHSVRPSVPASVEPATDYYAGSSSQLIDTYNARTSACRGAFSDT